MATMSGRLYPDSRSKAEGDESLFTGLVVSNPQKARKGFGWWASVGGHVVGIALLILVPLLAPPPPPQTTDYIRALIFDPPPPPPPPLPKGSALAKKTEIVKPVSPEAKTAPTPEPKLVAQIEAPKDIPDIRPPDAIPESEQFGSETGSDAGSAEGMEGGVEGGQVGGVLGGVLGGVVGGTGSVVFDYDQPPRPIRITKPQYPQEAFVKKIEGTVVVEILIDKNGNVVRARVIQSIPLLDKAAIATVKQWRFSPAIKDGRPVATVANAPVGFRIF